MKHQMKVCSPSPEDPFTGAMSFKNVRSLNIIRLVNLLFGDNRAGLLFCKTKFEPTERLLK